MKILKKFLILVLAILILQWYIYITICIDDVKVRTPDVVNISQKYNGENKINEVDTSTKEISLKNNSKGLCILMYHSIGYEKNNKLRIPQQQFRKHMEYIKDNGYITLTLQEVYSFFVENKPIPKKSVVITLDDGYLDNYKYAYPILKELGLKATIFVITNAIDKNNDHITSAQLKELQDNGIDIESHTLNHEQLNTLSYKMQLKTLIKSKETLEKILDKKVNYIAYPIGKYNKDTIVAAKSAGYIMGFVTGGKIARKDNGIYTLHRIGILSTDGINVLDARLKNQN